MTDELLRIDYQMSRVIFGEPDEDQLDIWSVKLQIGEGSDQAESGIAWETIARAELYGMDPGRSASLGVAPFDVADAHSADAAHYFEHVFDMDGGFLPDVTELFEWLGGRALFLHDVRVVPEHRRRGFASLLAADAILTLATDGTAVFAHPGPTDIEQADEDVMHLREETQNTRFLGALGFTPMRDRLWSLDLTVRDNAAALAAIRGSH